MKKFTAVGFDWSGVVFLHTVHYRRDGARILNISEDEFSVAYRKHNHLNNIQNMAPREFWTTVFTELGRASEVDVFLNYLENAPAGKLNQAMLPLIQLLENKGYKVGLFSNNTVDGALEARSFGVDDIFKIALFSAEVGCMKPHREAFELLASKLDVGISEMVFIDDTPKSLEKSTEIGYHPILYTDISRLLKELVACEILTVEDMQNL